MQKFLSTGFALWLMASTTSARADAVLVGDGTTTFPSSVAISVDVRSQVEATTVVLAMPPIETAGDFTLTVPPPDGAFPIGVDIDRGDGWVELPTIAGAAPSGGGGNTGAAFQAWETTAPLVAELSAIPAGPLTVRVRFVRILRRVNGDVAFEVAAPRCPLRASSDPGPMTTVETRVTTARDLVRFEATNATVEPSVRGGRVTAGPMTGDVAVGVTYTEASSGIGVQLLTHRTPTADPTGGDAGYFMLILDADPAPPTQPRAISMVIDHSGSMAGDKIAQARDVARAMLDNLDPTDSFTIHQFDDDVSSFRPRPVVATPENIQAARSWIKGIEANSSTNLNAGLMAGLAAPPASDRFDATILLSDGLANTGESNDKQILSNAWSAAGGDTRIFTFSVGADADFPLMQALATGSRGRHIDLNNSQATHDMVLRAKELFQDIRDVRLTDLSMQVTNIGVTNTLPETPPDLFSGGQVIIVGRYTTPGEGEVQIRGTEGVQPFEKTFIFNAPDVDDSFDIIKHVWATEKVRALMGSLAGGASQADVRSEVEALGLAYRIQTPYTHFSGSFDAAGSGTGGGCSTAGDAGLASGLVMLGIALGIARRPRRRRAVTTSS